MNALQQLIADYKADHPDESYASIARRGSTVDHIIPRQTVYSAATTERLRQTPHLKTIEGLARGMEMPVAIVAAAAADAAGYQGAIVSSDVLDARGRLIVASVGRLMTGALTRSAGTCAFF